VIDRSADEPFTAPWQARAFAMAVVAADRMGVDWDEFRDRLKAAIAARPEQPYYESWLDALEQLAADRADVGARPIYHPPRQSSR
jgi:nitrile hydratase accessory protein